MKMKPYCVGYPVNRMLDDEDASSKRLLKSLLGDMDQEEYEDYMSRSAERRRKQKEAGLKKAKALLRQMNRPVCRRDMLMAMDMAILRQVEAFDRMETPPEAAALIALVICKNMLMDGPLHEEA